MSDRHEASDDMFRLPPVSLLRMPPNEEEGSGSESCAADQDTESEMGEVEEDVHPDPLISSGSAVPANLLYLSDQVRKRGGRERGGREGGEREGGGREGVGEGRREGVGGGREGESGEGGREWGRGEGRSGRGREGRSGGREWRREGVGGGREGRSVGKEGGRVGRE